VGVRFQGRRVHRRQPDLADHRRLQPAAAGPEQQPDRGAGPNSTANPNEAPGFATGFQDAHTGDLNYKKGDLFALYLKGSEEMLLKFPDKYKFFVRGSWLLDAKAGDTQFVPLANPAYTQAAHDLRLYDLWGARTSSSSETPHGCGWAGR